MARIPYVSPDDLDPEYTDLVYSSLQPGKRANIYAALANNPPVLAAIRSFLAGVWTDTGLTDRQRELVILAVAAHIESPFEWHHHVNIGTGVGISREECNAIVTRDDDVFDADDRALLTYARAVVSESVTDETHDALAGAFDDATVVGTASLAAGYLMVGRLIDALDVEIAASETFVGWTTE